MHAPCDRCIHLAHHVAEQVRVFLRHAVADGVGKVESRRARVGGGPEHLDQEVGVAASRVLT
jgi:hypothetical protein